MSFSFKYQSIKLDSGQIIKRPVVPLILRGNKNSIEVLGYLDTGSDVSLISKDFADLIGINYFEQTEIFGITGDEMEVDIGNVNIIVGKRSEKYNFTIPTLITRKEDSQVIIGRKGFFDQFKITFIESEKKVTFKKLN